MKKIMFNDKYDLTYAVLSGKKTMTRRIYQCPYTWNGIIVSGYRICRNKVGDMFTHLVDEDEREIEGSYLKPKYELGEVIAIAQSYNRFNEAYNLSLSTLNVQDTKGWFNKMFVKAELMPHQIEIIGIKIERLQDISEDDCIKEGIIKIDNHNSPVSFELYNYKEDCYYDYSSPINAFRSITKDIFYKGAWEQNPYVFVYEFKLIK